MNYYQARQREVDGRFDYTCRNNSDTWPLGYCRPYRPFKVADFFQSGPHGEAGRLEIERLNARYARFQHKYHTDGHATAEEAELCFRGFELDNHLSFGRMTVAEAKDRRLQLYYCQAPYANAAKTKDCNELTASSAWISGGGTRHWNLCEEHLNRETVEKLFQVGVTVSSY